MVMTRDESNILGASPVCYTLAVKISYVSIDGYVCKNLYVSIPISVSNLESTSP